jgi:hypothetical protein
MEVEPTIVCVDCGGRAHLLSHPREDGTWWPGDIVSYRCQDCLDRWDLVLPAETEGDGPHRSDSDPPARGSGLPGEP